MGGTETRHTRGPASFLMYAPLRHASLHSPVGEASANRYSRAACSRRTPLFATTTGGTCQKK